jgi:hypothetical protein
MDLNEMFVTTTLATKSPWLFMANTTSSGGLSAKIGEAPEGGVDPKELG